MSLTLAPDPRPGQTPTIPMAQLADAGWERSRAGLRELVTRHGSLRVRGAGLTDVDAAARAFRALTDRLMPEREAFAARVTHAPGIYSATQWPAQQPMCSHHELSYAAEFPALMAFACLTPATEGGATGLADAAAVLADLPADLVGRFEREGWLLVRCYNEDIGASYAEAFGTDDRLAVEAYCHANAIQFQWQPDGGLVTRQRRPAVVAHPVTGQRCWFNQIAFLNEWTMAEEVREYLLDVYGPDGLPFTTRFGNGAPLSEDVVATVNEVYEAHTRREPWAAGDLLLVDNIRTAHSRDPYRGPRELVVGLGDPVRMEV